jgi:glucose-1-phosphate adenylyltransferase
VQGCKIKGAMLGEGCYVQPGCIITNSIIGLRTKIGANCRIEDCLVMGSDFYETPEDCDTTESCVPMGIGANSCASPRRILRLGSSFLFCSSCSTFIP